ncbi:ABC-type sulfate transport system permease component [Vibrio astriarenae]|nr:ABC-type sulfate transport system permease component [Vibrio sp. C7]
MEAQKNEERASWYASAEHNIDKYTPYIVYGQTYNDNDKTGNSVTLGLRYDLFYNVSINAEWQYFKAYNGSTGAFSLEPWTPLEDKDANLYTIMVNFVF